MRRRKAMFSDMNIVPYLDVMLVLLVIFMATTPMVQMGVNIACACICSRDFCH
jgi:biopolymer transport protein TolR